jgi:hypothetical protein
MTHRLSKQQIGRLAMQHVAQIVSTTCRTDWQGSILHRLLPMQHVAQIAKAANYCQSQNKKKQSACLLEQGAANAPHGQ